MSLGQTFYNYHWKFNTGNYLTDYMDWFVWILTVLTTCLSILDTQLVCRTQLDFSMSSNWLEKFKRRGWGVSWDFYKPGAKPYKDFEEFSDISE